MKKLIAQGAEAKLYKENSNLIKQRIKKSYRIKELDEQIRKVSTRRETKLLEKASSLISVPKILHSSDKSKEIKMEFIQGELIKNILDNLKEKERNKLCQQIGLQISILHKNNIIHSDLTTSNMILKNKKIYFIDFGLGFFSNKLEDKAVDLHLLKQALESKHYKHFEESFKNVLVGYKKNYNESDKVLERLKKVEQRGRYKRKIK